MLGSDGISSKKSPRVVRGQLLLPTQGATGGILIGGDAGLYRSVANRVALYTGDELLLPTNSRIRFRDEDIYIYSNTDGFLTIYADNTIQMVNRLDMVGNEIKNALYLELDETTTPAATADHAKMYAKADNKLYFQDGAGVEHTVAFV